MKRRWHQSWFLRGVGLIVLLIVGFYIEEDLRGALAWAAAKKEIEATGVSLDPKDYIPAPVPDAQNFGALPIFKLSPDPKNENYPWPMALHQALDPLLKFEPVSKDDVEPNAVPYLGNWSKGEPPDPAAIQKQLLKLCQEKWPDRAIPPTATPLDLFEMLCPVPSDLRSANATLPECRFEHDYADKMPIAMPLSGTTGMMTLAKALSYDERLALICGKPDIAFEDFKVAWKVDSGLRKEPFLVSGLVAVGVDAIQLYVISEGLAKHVWNDQQLAELDNELGKIDDLTGGRFFLRGEIAFTFIPTMDFTKALSHRSWLHYSIQAQSNGAVVALFDLMPSGWVDRFKADGARFHILGAKWMVDPAAHRVYPEKEAKLNEFRTDAGKTNVFRKFEAFFGPTAHAVETFAHGQANLDMARIACRLERYHLAHGQYPSTLDDLVPAYGADLPRDVANGEPYRYRLNPDGTYRLYSVAWNQKDDGGDGKRDKNNDYPDWVWMSYPNADSGK